MEKFKVGVYVNEIHVLDMDIEASDGYEAELEARDRIKLEFDVDDA